MLLGVLLRVRLRVRWRISLLQLLIDDKSITYTEGPLQRTFSAANDEIPQMGMKRPPQKWKLPRMLLGVLLRVRLRVRWKMSLLQLCRVPTVARADRPRHGG